MEHKQSVVRCFRDKSLKLQETKHPEGYSLQIDMADWTE